MIVRDEFGTDRGFLASPDSRSFRPALDVGGPWRRSGGSLPRALAGLGRFRRRRGEHPQAHMAMLKALGRAHRFLDDGCICLSNNAAEWAVRGIAMTDSFCTSFSSV
jgi:hypothetical protein